MSLNHGTTSSSSTNHTTNTSDKVPSKIDNISPSSSNTTVVTTPALTPTSSTSVVNNILLTISCAVQRVDQAIAQNHFSFARERLEILLLETYMKFASESDRKKILSRSIQLPVLSAKEKEAPIKTPVIEHKQLEELKHDIRPSLVISDDVKRLYDTASARAVYLSPSDQIQFYQEMGDHYRESHEDLQAILAYTSGIWVAKHNHHEPALIDALQERLSTLESVMLGATQKAWIQKQGNAVISVVAEKITQLKTALMSEVADTKRHPILLAFFNELIPIFSRLTQAEYVPFLITCYELLQTYLQQWIEYLETRLKSVDNALPFREMLNELKPVLALWNNHCRYPTAAETALHSCDAFIRRGDKLKVLSENELNGLLQQSNELSSALLNPDSQALLAPRPITSTTAIHAKTLLAARRLLIQQTEHPEATKTFTRSVIDVLNVLLAECATLLGEPPCHFCVLGMGSMARGELSLRSDIDIALLIENEIYREADYFSYLIDLLQTKLLCLGESSGLAIDKDDIADIKLGVLVNTPAGYVEEACQKATAQAFVKAYKLPYAMALYSNHRQEQNLFTNYQQKMAAYLQVILSPTALTPSRERTHQILGLRYLAEHRKQWLQQQDEKAATTLDLKRRYLQPLQFWCLDMAICFGLVEKTNPSQLLQNVPDILKALEQRQLIHPGFIQALQQAWRTLQQLRLQLHQASLVHLASQRQHNLHADAALAPSAVNNSANYAAEILQGLTLSNTQQASLSAIERGILEPAYQTIDHWQQQLTTETPSKNPFDPMATWFDRTLIRYLAAENTNTSTSSSTHPSDEEMRRITITWTETLCSRRALASEHLATYQRLPELFKAVYYATLKHLNSPAHLLNAIAEVPYTDGTRPAYTKAYEDWQRFLLQHVTSELPTPEAKAWASKNDKASRQQLAKAFPNQLLVQWLNPEGKLCSGFLHPDVQRTWQQKKYLKQNASFDLARIKAPPEDKVMANTKIDGRGYVFPFQDAQGKPLAYAKLYPEMPGRQALAESLAWHVSGYGAVSTLCKVTCLATGEAYPLLLSQAAGETLQNCLRRESNLTSLEAQLDAESFTLKFLETLLLGYEDDKFDNLALLPFFNANGEIRYRLISFDSDRAFATPFIQEELTEGNIRRKQLKINVKSAVYCMDAMLKPLHPTIVARFRKMQPLAILTHWLREPLAHHLVGRLFNKEEAIHFNQHKVQECFIPAVFELGSVSRLYQTFLRIQTAFHDEEPPTTHLELFSRIEPHLASFYAQALEKPWPAKQRFDSLPTHYTVSEEVIAPSPQEVKEPPATSTASQPIVTSSTHTPLSPTKALRVQQTTGNTRTRMLNSITIKTAKGDFKRAIAEGAIALPSYVLEKELLPTHRHYQAVQQIRQALLMGDSKPFLALSQQSYNTDYLKEQIIASLDWSALKPRPGQRREQLQKTVLKTLAGGQYYRLSFANCQALIYGNLAAILKNSYGLQALDVSGCVYLNDASVRLLANSHSLLTSLNLRGLPELKDLSQPPPLLNFFGDLPKPLIFPQLRRLNVSGCAHLSTLLLEAPLLQWFAAKGSKALPRYWKLLASLFANEATLTSLDLSGSRLSDAAGQAIAEALKTSTTLTSLNLNDNQLSDTVGQAIADILKINPTLTSLGLSYNQLSDAAGQTIAEALKTNTTLTSLDLYGNNRLRSTEIQAINKALERNKFLAQILKTNTTTRLDLSNNQLDVMGIKIIADVLKTNTTLTSLDLSYNKLSDEAVQAIADVLKTNTTLTSLDLSSNNLNDEAVQAIADVLKTNTTLTSLDLSRNKLSDAAVQVITDALKTNTTLTSLSLSWNHLSDVVVQAIADALKTNIPLTSLDLNYNYLGDAAGQTIADALKTNSPLTSLNLSRNWLGDTAGQAIADALKINTILTSLDLSYNKLSDKAVQAIVDALKTNTTLTSLDLSRNWLGDAAGQAIADALKTNTTLTSLDLSHNYLGDTAGQAIAEALKINTTLASLDLSRNEQSTATWQAIAEALKVNTTLISLNLGWDSSPNFANAQAINQALEHNQALATARREQQQSAIHSSAHTPAETKSSTVSVGAFSMFGNAEEEHVVVHDLRNTSEMKETKDNITNMSYTFLLSSSSSSALFKPKDIELKDDKKVSSTFAQSMSSATITLDDAKRSSSASSSSNTLSNKHHLLVSPAKRNVNVSDAISQEELIKSRIVQCLNIPTVNINHVVISSDRKTITFTFYTPRDCEIFARCVKDYPDFKLATREVATVTQTLVLFYDDAFKSALGFSAVSSTFTPHVSS